MTHTEAFYNQLLEYIDALHAAYINNDQLQFIHVGTDIGMSLSLPILAIGEPNKTQNYQRTVMNIQSNLAQTRPDISSYLTAKLKAVDTEKYGESSILHY